MNFDMPIAILTQEDLIEAGCFDMKTAIDVTEDAFKKYACGDVIFPEKVSVIFDEVSQNRINCLPAAILSEKVYGMKWISVFPDNPSKHGKPNISAVYLLSELETGYPIAFLEGSMCSNMRTAAVGALAGKYLARNDSVNIGFIGAGEQAKSHFLAFKALFPDIKKCYVSSRTHASEHKFVEQMSRFHPDVEYIMCESNYESAASNADIIVTAISGQEKILRPEWIKRGAFYCHVAGLEDDFGVALSASKIVCDNWNIVKHRTQTISQMYKLGILHDKDIYADLHEIVTGTKSGRDNDDEFIYFNSVGMSFVDTALSLWMYKKSLKLRSNYVSNVYYGGGVC